MSRFQRLGGLLLSGLLPACAGSGAARDGTPAAVLVRLHDFRTGERFELASESHTDRLAYYSDSRHDAARKVQTDEIMSALVGELARQGYEGRARAGRAPAIGASDVIRWGLEVQDGEVQSHWLVGSGSAPADWQAFQKCRDLFLQLYNITVSYQTVQNDEGKSYFDEQKRAAAGQKRR
jgi:hypothetical protein